MEKEAAASFFARNRQVRVGAEHGYLHRLPIGSVVEVASGPRRANVRCGKPASLSPVGSFLSQFRLASVVALILYE
jgi:hypothetical protein